MYTYMVLTLHHTAWGSNTQPRSPRLLKTPSTLHDIEKRPLKRMFTEKQKTKVIFTLTSTSPYLQFWNPKPKVFCTIVSILTWKPNMMWTHRRLLIAMSHLLWIAIHFVAETATYLIIRCCFRLPWGMFKIQVHVPNYFFKIPKKYLNPKTCMVPRVSNGLWLCSDDIYTHVTPYVFMCISCINGFKVQELTFGISGCCRKRCLKGVYSFRKAP